ncbi:uncharacterized protein LOC128180578 [Crassostrea angulata]|uniref:uncharacterized protein LOC128180578 n=1 Tax=Magallana angulata TaxID=2784310 RepID=UPI0022B10C5F|nr:uncharacterized protein LOC128180578 [Crassostrea angulata]
MIASKLSTVKGVRSRECLLEQLNGYYEMGVTCLLQSPTVRKMVEPVICNILVRIEPFLGHIKSAADTDACIIKEIYGISFLNRNIREDYFILRFIIVLSNQSLTEYETLTLQKCTAYVLVNTAFLYLDTSTVSTNKVVYRSDRLIGNLLKLAGSVGNVSCMLYLALYYYRTCRYREALHVTALVRSRLTQPYIMYYTVYLERYNESVPGWSLSKRMKKAWVYHVHMLSVLCNYRLGKRSQCLQSLTDLQTLLLYDDRRYVDSDTRDLSWQILGICQHAVGDLHRAEQSYQQSLRQKPYHKIQNATKYRMALVSKQLSETANLLTKTLLMKEQKETIHQLSLQYETLALSFKVRAYSSRCRKIFT